MKLPEPAEKSFLTVGNSTDASQGKNEYLETTSRYATPIQVSIYLTHFCLTHILHCRYKSPKGVSVGIGERWLVLAVWVQATLDAVNKYEEKYTKVLLMGLAL